MQALTSGTRFGPSIFRTLRNTNNKTRSRFFGRSRRVASERGTGQTVKDQSKQSSIRATVDASPAPVGNPRIEKLLSRTPRFLQKHVLALRNAPVTLVTAFLLLHEVTAILPLFGLAGLFHYYHWLPTSVTDGEWKALDQGIEKFGKYLRKKGWVTDEQVQAAGGQDTIENTTLDEITSGEVTTRVRSDGTRLVVEFATAYAITKMLLPARLVVSAYCAPWFAKWTIVPIISTWKRIVGRR